MGLKLTQEQRDEQMQRFDAYLAERAQHNTLLEKNKAVMRKHSVDNAETKGFREGMKRKYGFDPVAPENQKDADRFPVMKEGFSWKKFNQQLEGQLKEADSGSAFTQFLVAGLLQNVIGMYNLVKTSYQEWVTVTSTNLLDTPVAPLHGLSFPREVGEQMPYPVSQTAALSLKFHARKYGTMYEVTKELLEDDQSGQFKQQTGMLGEYLQLLTEVLVYGRLGSVNNASYSGFTPGVSETLPSGETRSSWPWCASNGGTNSLGLIGGAYNKGTSAVALSDANVKVAFNVLSQQKNLLGILLNVKPNRFLISPYYQWDIAILLNSAYYPAGAQAAGVTGGAFAINPLKGIADATIAPFMGDNSGNFASLSKAWYLVDDSKPWFQLLMRTPVSVEQENPQSGQSFERDICRFKANTRMIADFVDPRFAYQGSDGSV